MKPQSAMKQTKTALMLQENIADDIADYLTGDSYSGMVEVQEIFTGTRVPSITFDKYVRRIITQTNKWLHEKDGPDSTGVRVAVLGIQFLEKAGFVLTRENIHRCFLIATLLGLKLLDDGYMSNTYWSHVGGIFLREVNDLEIAFCNALKWDFNICSEEHKERMAIFTSVC
jgi:hypothetical protein